MKYYGIIQMRHGADHVFVYNEDQIKVEIEYLAKIGHPDILNEAILPTDPVKKSNGIYDKGVEVSDIWPYGGSNNNCSMICLLENEQDVLTFLNGPALGPDVEDPMFCDMSEYYYDIETDEGCAKDVLESLHLTVEEVVRKAMEAVDQEKAVFEALELNYNGLEEMRFSEASMLLEIKNFIRSIDMKNAVFVGNEDYKNAVFDVPDHLAGELLHDNDITYQWKEDFADQVSKVKFCIGIEQNDGLSEAAGRFYIGDKTLEVCADEPHIEEAMDEIILGYVNRQVFGAISQLTISKEDLDRCDAVYNDYDGMVYTPKEIKDIFTADMLEEIRLEAIEKGMKDPKFDIEINIMSCKDGTIIANITPFIYDEADEHSEPDCTFLEPYYVKVDDTAKERFLNDMAREQEQEKV